MMDELNLTTLAFLTAHADSSEDSQIFNQSDPDKYLVAHANRLWASSTESPPGVKTLSSCQLNGEITHAYEQLIGEVFTSGEKYERFLNHRGNAAQDLLDLLQKLLDHASPRPKYQILLYIALVRLCRKSELAPRCFDLQVDDVTLDKAKFAWRAGRYGDIYQGLYHKTPICLKKIIKYSTTDIKKVQKAFIREAVIWGQLQHPNILPFWGIYHPHTPEFYLVSPWITNDDIVKFLSTSHADRPRLICGIAAGLKYLHEKGVIHGDLKFSNILVANAVSNHAVIADFGLSYVSGSNGLHFDNEHNLSSRHERGSIQGWEAPEILDPDQKTTTASDVFSFGLVCYAMFITPRISNNLGTLPASMNSVQNQIRSTEAIPITKPAGCTERGLTDDIWEWVSRCLSKQPKGRPTAAEIAGRIGQLSSEFKKWTYPSRPEFETSSGVADATIARANIHLQKLLR